MFVTLFVRPLALVKRFNFQVYAHSFIHIMAYSIYACVWCIYKLFKATFKIFAAAQYAIESTQSVVQKTLYKISLAAQNSLKLWDVHLENVLNANSRIQCELQNGFRRRRRGRRKEKNVLAISRYYGIPIRSVCVQRI